VLSNKACEKNICTIYNTANNVNVLYKTVSSWSLATCKFSVEFGEGLYTVVALRLLYSVLVLGTYKAAFNAQPSLSQVLAARVAHLFGPDSSIPLGLERCDNIAALRRSVNANSATLVVNVFVFACKDGRTFASFLD